MRFALPFSPFFSPPPYTLARPARAQAASRAIKTLTVVLSQTLKVNPHYQAKLSADTNHKTNQEIKSFLKKKQLLHQPKFTVKKEAHKPPEGATRADTQLPLPTGGPSGAPTSAPVANSRSSKRKPARDQLEPLW